MNTVYKIVKAALMVLVFFVMATGCKKTTQPALGDYAKDQDPRFPLYPGGPLKFYAAFDGAGTDVLRNAVDSIRANFPASNTSAIGTGISGKCYQGSETALATYAGVNDFTKYKNFTIAFWIKTTPQASGKGTNFAFCLNAKGYSWTNCKMFLEFEDWSTTTVGNAKLYVMDQWTEYVNANGMPNVLNGNWHHLAFTYDGTSIKCYIDGTLFRTNALTIPYSTTPGAEVFGGFESFTIGGPNKYTHDNQTWMNNFDGSIDQFRLYGTALTATEVGTLFANKQ
jgi:hypothetical protein